jgi:hypothetical protein
MCVQCNRRRNIRRSDRCEMAGGFHYRLAAQSHLAGRGNDLDKAAGRSAYSSPGVPLLRVSANSPNTQYWSMG